MTIVLLAMVPALAISLAPPQAPAPVEVEPTELALRRDLLGKEVVIDDRIKMFWPNAVGGTKEIILNRTSVLVRLPKALELDSRPTSKAIRVRGVLRQEGKGLVCDVTARPQLFADDQKRLESEIRALLPDDLKNRAAWADWTLRRASAFGDEALRARGVELHAEVIDRELARPESRTPEAILALARRARDKGLPEPKSSALAHLGFRLRLASSKAPSDFEGIAKDVSEFLPGSKSAQNADPRRKFEAYERDPASGYLQADAAGRACLDRRLWSDAVAESLGARATAEPEKLLALAAEAKTRLPDRPEVAGGFKRRALEGSAGDVAMLRRSEMLELARIFREDENQPDKAQTIVRTWLDAKKAGLSRSSADSHIDLAKDYLSLLKDKSTTAELLRKALEIEPSSREATDQFLRMGYLLTDGSWQDPQEVAARPADAPESPRATPGDDAFFGLTPAEVKAQLGEPKRRSRVASQGRISIQWAYDSNKGTQYIDFLQKIGETQPTVVGRYTSR